jgi:hypothetical protein
MHNQVNKSSETRGLNRLSFGSSVFCADQLLGELEGMVIDPAPRRVTHLVVQPMHVGGAARLVPIELAEAGPDSGSISLRCSLAAARQLPNAREVSAFPIGRFPQDGPDYDVGVRDIVSMPQYGPGPLVDYEPDPEPDIVMIYDRVPKGEVEIRRASLVAATDDEAFGRLDGLFIDDGHITHVLTRHGHLWRKRRMTVPIADVSVVRNDGISLHLSKRQLKDL